MGGASISSSLISVAAPEFYSWGGWFWQFFSFWLGGKWGAEPLTGEKMPPWPPLMPPLANLPILSSKGPQNNVSLHHQGPNFSFCSSGHLASQFPRSIAPSWISAPNSFIMSSKWWSLILHRVIKGSKFIIGSSRGPNVTANFPSRYQGVPFIICVIKAGPSFPPSRHQWDPNFQNTPRITYEICTD